MSRTAASRSPSSTTSSSSSPVPTEATTSMPPPSSTLAMPSRSSRASSAIATRRGDERRSSHLRPMAGPNRSGVATRLCRGVSRRPSRPVGPSSGGDTDHPRSGFSGQHARRSGWPPMDPAGDGTRRGSPPRRVLRSRSSPPRSIASGVTSARDPVSEPHREGALAMTTTLAERSAPPHDAGHPHHPALDDAPAPERAPHRESRDASSPPTPRASASPTWCASTAARSSCSTSTA